MLLLIFLFSLRERKESSRERERERETKRSLPLCITAACGEDSELKVVALKLHHCTSLFIVIVGVWGLPWFFPFRVFHVKYLVYSSLYCFSCILVFPVFCELILFLGCGRARNFNTCYNLAWCQSVIPEAFEVLEVYSATCWLCVLI